MGKVGTLIEFAASTTIVSNDVDQNFADLKSAINSAVFTDETVTITAALKLANAVWINARNAGDTADVNVIRLNSSNSLELGTSVVIAGSLTPDVDSNYLLGGDAARWLQIYADSIVLTTSTPASAAAAGTTGTIAWDSSFIYVCVATNTWKRVGIATW